MNFCSSPKGESRGICARGLQRPAHSIDQRSGSRSGASRPHSKHPELLTASCRGRRDQRLRRLRSNRPAVNRHQAKASRRTARRGRFRQPRRCAGRTRLASSWAGKDGQMRRTARRGRAGQPRCCCCRAPAWGRFRQPRLPAIRERSRWQARLRGKVACATGCRSATIVSAMPRNATIVSGRHVPAAAAQCDRMPQSFGGHPC